MKEKQPVIALILVLIALLLSGIGCHLIFPFAPADYVTQPPYYCTAEIYRDLAGDNRFTEQYNTYLWPKYDWDQDGQIDSDDAYILCSNKIEDYIDEYMAPGFIWKKQHITVNTANMRMDGTDCSDVSPVSPVYGGPWGSALSWQDPDGGGPGEIPADRAYVSIRMEDADGTEHTAEPYVEHALVTLAESTGLRDSFGYYDPTERHVRIAHMEIDLKEFDIADVRVTDLHVHNIGTIATSGYGTLATIEPQSAKLFMYARGENDDGSGVTRQCILNDRGTGLGYVIYPNPYFLFLLETQIDVGGLPLWVRIRLTSPYGIPFNMHQPYVTLRVPANWKTTSPVDLTPYGLHDGDNDLARILWFEDFESSTEVFLGEGNLLAGVPFAVGEHDITVVAYDNQGAYYPYSSTLTVLPPPLSIISPKDGECWEAGSQHEIEWEPGDVTGPVRIMFSGAGYAPPFWLILENATPNDGSYIWTLPLNATRNAVLKICDTADPATCGVNTAPFTISSPDDCYNAVAVTDGQYKGTLVCSSNDGNASCGLSSGQTDVWYGYRARAPGTLSVNTCGTSDTGGQDAGMDTVLSLHADCGDIAGSELPNGCNDDWINDPLYACLGVDEGDARDSSVSVSVITGQQLLVRVSKHPDSAAGDFNLNVALNAESCPGDFDVDRDVDGTDLGVLKTNPGWLDLSDFAPDFGRNQCP